MGILSRLLCKQGSAKKEEAKRAAVQARQTRRTAAPTPPPETENRSHPSTDRDISDEESEIVIDDLIAGVPKYYGDNMSHEFGIGEAEDRRKQAEEGLERLPSLVGNMHWDDDVSCMSMGSCRKSVRGGDLFNDKSQFSLLGPAFEEEEDEDEKEQECLPKSPCCSIGVRVEDIKPKVEERGQDPGGHDLTTGTGAEVILTSHNKSPKKKRPSTTQPPKNYNNHNPYYQLPHSPKPRQRNSLLKYQQSTSTKAAQMKQQIQGYFRYVPRGTEDNDVSVISI